MAIKLLQGFQPEQIAVCVPDARRDLVMQTPDGGVPVIGGFIGRLMDSPIHTHTLVWRGRVMSAGFAQISPTVGALHRYVLSVASRSQDNHVAWI